MAKASKKTAKKTSARRTTATPRRKSAGKAFPLFTIGYEQAKPASVFDELKHAKVDTLIDVRAVAASRRPGFSKRQLAAALQAALATARGDELDRGVTLVGPHRDELALGVNGLPSRGYASHGESWSLALALRLASYDLLRADGAEPVLILDDVFAELDADRRERLASLVAPAEQVLITAAVAADVPDVLAGARVDVMAGQVRRVR